MSIYDQIPQEINLNSQEVVEAARNDPDFLAALSMPEIFMFCWPTVFKAVWNWLTQAAFDINKFQRLALGLPRGFGKTTMVKLLVLFCILFTQRKFILVISVTAKHAENIIADIVDMLDEPNVRKVFGSWRVGIETDTQGLKKFSFRGRDIILAGLGAGGSIRGLNLKNARPDTMIFEDIQSREEADSKTVSDALYRWLIGTAMKAKSPRGCLMLFVGNMYPTDNSILKKLKSNKYWVKFIAGGILADGTSLWEELQPLMQLLEEFEADLASGHPEIFYSEVLNDENATVNFLIDISKLPHCPVVEGDIAGGNFIIIDPSNDKANSDAVSIGYFEVHDGLPVLMELIDDRLSPGETIRKSLEICMRKGCRLIAVESNAYQYSLLYWFNFICQQMQIIGIEAVEVYSGSYSKVSRIIKSFKSLQDGEIFYHPKVASQVNFQIQAFNPMKRDNTDGILDLITYAPKVMDMYATFIVTNTIVDQQDWNATKVVEFNSCF